MAEILTKYVLRLFIGAAFLLPGTEDQKCDDGKNRHERQDNEQFYRHRNKAHETDQYLKESDDQRDHHENTSAYARCF